MTQSKMPGCCSARPAPKIKDLDALTQVYGALADPTRLRILALLRDGEVCVCDIHASLDVPQPTASRHLAYLRKAGLVDARRAGTWMHYRLTPIDNPVVAAVVSAALHALSHTAASVVDERRLQVARKAATFALHASTFAKATADKSADRS